MHNSNIKLFFTFAAIICRIFFLSYRKSTNDLIFKRYYIRPYYEYCIYNKWTIPTTSGSSHTGMTKIGLDLPIIIARLIIIIDSLTCNERIYIYILIILYISYILIFMSQKLIKLYINRMINIKITYTIHVYLLFSWKTIITRCILNFGICIYNAIMGKKYCLNVRKVSRFSQQKNIFIIFLVLSGIVIFLRRGEKIFIQ